eukprot:GEMP01073113.1.p1 GENE.GEMP01073113.1~~GEMP01073113.1.p1  ORF type:complete len:301 (-),score=48.56 GEMP01073113.1:199-1101(-)
MSFIDYTLKPDPETAYVPPILPKQECFAHNRGNCNRGAACKFAHIGRSERNERQDGGPGFAGDRVGMPVERCEPEVPPASAPVDHAIIPGGHARCVDFVRGRCRRGNQCRFPHQDLCIDFARGNCQRPDCPRFHPRPKKDKKRMARNHWDTDAASPGRPQERVRPDIVDDPNDPPIVHRPRTCVDFVEGRCARGRTCKFVHPQTCTEYNNGECTADVCPFLHVCTEQGIDRIDPNLCFDYKVGRCARGQNCRFIHDGPEDQDLGGCFDFSVGRCKRGDACKFRHDLAPTGIPRHQRSAPY